MHDKRFLCIKKISEFFSKYFDVICFDFMGHGKRGGMYTFTAKELIHIDAVIRLQENTNITKFILQDFLLAQR